jgi:tol-pal system protein YbgF
MRLLNFRLHVAAGLCAVLALPSAYAGLFDDEEARKAILDLRAKVEENRKAHSDENAQLRRSVLDLSNQIEQLRQELARMRGANEQLVNDVAKLQQQQKNVSQSFDERMRQFEPQPVTLDGRQVMVDPAEKRGYEAALAQFRANDFAKAAASFSDFAARYPKSPLAPPAFYYLGNAYYGLRDCKQAADVFTQLATRYPDDARAPEALLSAGNCQLELGNKLAARRAYEAVMKQYPATEEAGTAKERLPRTR